MVPAGVYLRAFVSRFVTTWCSRSSSPTTSTRVLGQLEPPAVVGGEHPGVGDRLEQQPGQVHRLPLQRPAGVEAGEQQQVLDQRGHPAGLLLDLAERGAHGRRRRRGGGGPARCSPAMVASGVRSSCEASATNWRTCCSLRCRASSDDSTWASSAFRAAPTWPTSVRSSVRCSGTRSVRSISPDGQRQRGDGVRGLGDLAQRPQLAAYDVRSRCPRRPGRRAARAGPPAQTRLASVSSTSSAGSPETTEPSARSSAMHPVVAEPGEVDRVRLPVGRHVGERVERRRRRGCCGTARPRSRR